MAETKEKWIKSTWAIAIFSVVIGPLIYDFLKEKPIMSTFLSFLTFDLKVWWVLLALATLFIWLKLYVSRTNRRIKSAVPDYKEDEINGRRWTWQWEWNIYEREWSVIKLKCYCPHCDTRLDKHEAGGKVLLDCPRCFHLDSGNASLGFGRITSLICDNYDRREKQKNENVTNVQPKK